MKRGLPPYVYERKRKSGTYLYYERPGRPAVRIHARPGSPDFLIEIGRLAAEVKSAPVAQNFAGLIASYRDSRRWKKLAPRTREDYARVLAYIEAKLGKVAVAKITRRDVLRLQEANLGSVRFANYVVQVIRILFEQAIDLNWIKAGQNPAKGVALFTSGGPKREPWPADKIAAFREASSLGTRERTVFELCLGTGQRIGDVLDMRWGDIDGDGIRVRQNKTGRDLWLPMTQPLREALDAAPRRRATVDLTVDGRLTGPTIVQRADGGPASYRIVADGIMAVRRKIGAVHLDIHALRHTTAAELASLGLSDEIIQSVTGHATAAMLRHYTEKTRQRARAGVAGAARKRAAEQTVDEAGNSEQPSEQPEAARTVKEKEQ